MIVGFVANVRTPEIVDLRRVGASREMISRIFSDLAAGGYVRKESGRLVIVRKPPAHW